MLSRILQGVGDVARCDGAAEPTSLWLLEVTHVRAVFATRDHQRRLQRPVAAEQRSRPSARR